MAAFTRVPGSLLRDAGPIKWFGDASKKAEVLAEVGTDEDLYKGYFFLQTNDDGTSQLFAMTFNNSVPSFVEVSSGGGVDAGDFATEEQFPQALKEALSNKLSADFADLPKSEEAVLADTSMVVGSTADGEPVTISMSQIKSYVNTDADKGWCGYFTNLAKLEEWVAEDPNIDLSKPAAYWAILADTDTIWVYDHDANPPAWKDTGSSTALPLTTKIEGGEGIVVTGTLADGTVTISADTDNFVLNTDPRLLPSANIIAIGTEEEREALKTDPKVNADQVGKYFIVKNGTGKNAYGILYRLVEPGPDPEWLRIGEPQQQQTQKGSILIEDITIEASQEKAKITLDEYYSEEDYIFLVFISGILQLKDVFMVTSNDVLKKTTISFGGRVTEDMPCNVVLLPR